MPDPAAMEPLLLPTPTSIQATGGLVDCSQVAGRWEPPTPAPPEAWSLPDESDVSRLLPGRVGSGILTFVETERIEGRPADWYRLDIQARSDGRPLFKILHAAG